MRERWETLKVALSITKLLYVTQLYPVRTFSLESPKHFTTEELGPDFQEETGGALNFRLPSEGNFT